MTHRIVPCLLGCAAVLVAPASHAAFSSLFVFGDSLSDSGNATLAVGANPGQVITSNGYVPSQPYGSGVFSNGPVWATSFAAGLGLAAQASLAGGTNYAFGGARTSGGAAPSLLSQAASYLQASGGVAPQDALYVVAGGGNNARDALQAIQGGADVGATLASAAATYAADLGTVVDQLQAAGARHIVVWNAPDLGLVPAVSLGGPAAVALGSLLPSTMNAALAQRLAAESGVLTFDLFGLLGSIADEPQAFSLENAADACGAPVAGCNPQTALFWDGIHPTAAGHQILSGAMLTAVAAIPEPGTYALMLAGLALVLCGARRRASLSN
ncbi:SGNH/GDSL hydrolase family protein [Aquincola sp. MAHUQ-54]|uniref:SGNH/GDSL hydrolase family protein n=1 Tax=Aquincola agrisoli TaxID=3119538 RepID=A0AAW9QA92_9BURK